MPARKKLIISDKSVELTTKETTAKPVSAPVTYKARRKKVAGWTEHAHPKFASFFTSDEFAAYPKKDGSFRVFKLDEKGCLGQEIGSFQTLEAVVEISPHF